MCAAYAPPPAQDEDPEGEDTQPPKMSEPPGLEHVNEISGGMCLSVSFCLQVLSPSLKHTQPHTFQYHSNTFTFMGC